MAKEKPAPKQPAAQPAAPNVPVQYPRDWGSMKPTQRREWMAKNRPNRPTSERTPAPQQAAPQAAPQGPAPQQPSEEIVSKQLVQVEVVKYLVTVGTREPVEVAPEELLFTVDSELEAWEEQCQCEKGEGGEESDDS